MNVAQNKLAAAYALHEKGDLAKAEKQYRALLRATPKHPDLLYLLGMLCLDTERSSMAAGFLDRAIRAAEGEGREVDPEWRLAHGTAIQRDGDHEAALAIFERVHADDPKSVNALFCKGTALQALERLDEATEAYKTLLDLDTQHAEAAYNIGITLRDAKNPEIAIIALRKAAMLKPDYVDALRALASLLEDSGWREDAVPVYRKLSRMLPEEIGVQVAASRVLILTGRVDEAEALLVPLLEQHPDHPMLINQYSSLRLYQGDHEEAKRLALRGLEINPKLPAIHLSLTMAERNAGDKERIAEMEALLEETEHNEDGLVALHFGLAGRYGSLKDYEESLGHYLKGNAAKRKSLDDKGFAYQRDIEDKMTARIIETSPREVFDGPTGSDSELPVFIVGMPRSGTSLTEQILASHPLIGGAGELSDMANAGKRMRDVLGYPRNPPTETALRRIAEMYLKRLREVDARALRVTDKMPGNYRTLRLIAHTFPNARVIHCRRNPIDNCLSCFMQNFGAEGLSWAFDLEDLAHQYKSYRQFMDHWREVLPLRMLEIDYEETVADQEGQSRKLIEFVGLDWDDACLDFHKTERAVVTASHSQVRQPIYNTSVGRWKRYGDGLAPLVEGLAEIIGDSPS